MQVHPLRRELEHVSFVSRSGFDHPYFSVSPKFVERQHNMHVRVASYPPLGVPSVVDNHDTSVILTVCLQSEEATEWDVELWHNAKDESNWEELPFEKEKNSQITSLHGKSEQAPHYFQTSLSKASSSERPVSFTIRFRAKGENDWRWARDLTGVDDGQLLFRSSLRTLQAKDDITTFFDDIEPDLSVELETSANTNSALIWSITKDVAPAQEDSSGFSHFFLGKPKSYVRWFALQRLLQPWFGPRQGKGYPFAEKPAFFYSFLREDGLHVSVLAVSGVNNVLTIFRHEAGKLKVCSRNDKETKGQAIVIVAVGETFEDANAAAMNKARDTVAAFSSVSEEDLTAAKKISQKLKHPNTSWVRDWYDGFAYCTWNGLGQNLTEEKIVNAVDSLVKGNVNITNLIIDDNWQTLDNEGKNQFTRGWTDFEANPAGFPNGMKTAIMNIRQKFPQIHHIAVWHALLGYWGGISPTGERVTVIDAPDVKRFYDDFYQFLASVGIDAVKTDVQYFVGEIDGAPARRSLISTYLSTWTSAQLRHFGATAISCMSQSPIVTFPYQLPSTIPAIPLRNSDDFFPEIEESHTWHIFCNAHNSLFTQHLNVLPDWDMFQTDHKWSRFHAAGRALSGGPIYITDEPGKHDFELIAQMTAKTGRGQTVILRPSFVGRSVEQYISFEEDRLLKMAVFDGHPKSGSSFLGLWNCHTNEKSQLISLSDFVGIKPSEQSYIVKSHRSGRWANVQWKVDQTPDLFLCTVAGHEWDILTIRPVEGPFEISESNTITISNFGLLGKLTGAVAIMSQSISTGTTDNRLPEEIKSKMHVKVTLKLKALGLVGLLTQKERQEFDSGSGAFVLLEGKPVPHQFVDYTTEPWLKIDVEEAWNEMKLVGRPTDELELEIFLT